MTYCSQQDLVDRFGTTKLVQLTDRVNKPASTIDGTTVTKRIEDAVSLINSYLAKKYELPLTVAVPEVLTTYAINITWFLLHGEAAGKDSPVRMAYDDALRWLKAVSQGSVVIEGAGEIIAAAGGGQIKTSTPNRVFTRDKLGDF
ncbi:DUF1320 domain-containing protein [Devosia sp. J2-20]|uniref:gp436 family protein n=1 Tax=Devosia sp. J2-20 TaxID=3026161 RepID=UPI00249AD73A|nr:DUF1320 domain-containing protein [Devosia sp. J2-20]WDR00747.1 DUF1320 domain-containing protein [Devosia sp. J2-20]